MFDEKRLCRRQIDFFHTYDIASGPVLIFVYVSFSPRFKSSTYIFLFLFYSEELFTQQVICNIENFGVLNLDPPLRIQDLVLMALHELNASETQPSSTGDLNSQAELIQKTLSSKSQILEKFFNINVTPSGDLLSLPIIVEGHTPVLAYLPNYILNLALCVDWDNERQCFDTSSKVTGKFYGKIAHKMDLTEWNWMVEHVLYAILKQFLMPNKVLIDSGAIIKVTSTQELYKVFERC